MGAGVRGKIPLSQFISIRLWQVPARALSPRDVFVEGVLPKHLIGENKYA